MEHDRSAETTEEEWTRGSLWAWMAPSRHAGPLVGGRQPGSPSALLEVVFEGEVRPTTAAVSLVESSPPPVLLNAAKGSIPSCRGQPELRLPSPAYSSDSPSESGEGSNSGGQVDRAWWCAAPGAENSATGAASPSGLGDQVLRRDRGRPGVLLDRARTGARDLYRAHRDSADPAARGRHRRRGRALELDDLLTLEPEVRPSSSRRAARSRGSRSSCRRSRWR